MSLLCFSHPEESEFVWEMMEQHGRKMLRVDLITRLGREEQGVIFDYGEGINRVGKLEKGEWEIVGSGWV